MIFQQQEKMIGRHLLFNSAYNRKVTMLNREVSKNDTDLPVTGFDTCNVAVTLKFCSK
jgi:hypothetical protein